MDDLLKNINSLKQVEEIEHYIDDYSPIYLSGLTDGFKPHLVLTLFKKFNETCLLIAENEKKQKNMLMISMVFAKIRPFTTRI